MKRAWTYFISPSLMALSLLFTSAALSSRVAQADVIQNTKLLLGGYDCGNAGDAFSAEFILTGRDLVQKLDLVYQSNTAVYDTTKLRAALATTEVISEEHVFLKGAERDAVNFFPAQNRIDVNRSRWRELRQSTETKDRAQLVLYEYLWITGVDDTNFQVSQRLIQLLSLGNYSPNVWYNPGNPMNTLIPKLDYAPAGCTMQTIKFDVKNPDETIEIETKGDCQDAYRRLRVVKSASVTPPSSNVHGLFHKYDLTVFDVNKQVIGMMTYTPKWGGCTLPSNDACGDSGDMDIGGISVEFWFLRDGSQGEAH